MTVAPRIGQGYDVHAFAPDDAGPLRLGGVEMDGPPLAGHSDADVVLHALTDAVLGAAALGDLGELVGVDEPATRGAASSAFVAEALRRVRAEGWRVGNADVTVIAQRPRLAPHLDAMRERIAGLLGVGEPAVSVKATSTDRLGAVGRGEGIACMAVVLLVPRATTETAIVSEELQP